MHHRELQSANISWGKGNEELIRFDLERYKHLYFHEVHTYTKAEFDKYIEEKFAGGTVS